MDIQKAKKHFEIIKSVDENGNETWSARDLMAKLGYDRWENFFNVIKKAAIACKNSGIDITGQFRATTKESIGGNGATIYAKDYRLTRYACYLIAQNGDSIKEQVAWAQSYFALQTRKQEVAVENQQGLERLTAREKLSQTEKKFAGVLYDHGVNGKGIGIIRAKDLTAEMTTLKTKEKRLNNPDTIGTTHEKHNKSVRQALVNENIYPERLPAEEDIKKLEQRINKENKSLPKPTKKPFKRIGLKKTSAIKTE